MLSLDSLLTAFFHDTIRHPFLDRLMPLVTQKWCWIPLIAGLVLYWVVDRRRGALVLITASFALLGLADLAADVLKGIVQRPRPGHTELEMSLAVFRATSFSFPSAHATNAFALSSLWSVLHPRLAVFFLASAGLVGISRVYLGDHYASDVFGGALLGGALGLAAGAALRHPRSPLFSSSTIPSRSA